MGKRQNTLKTLIDVTTSPNPTPTHELRKSLSNARKFSVGDLTAVNDEEEYDPEIFKYLSELVGNDANTVPLTPSTRSVMKDLFVDAMNDDELSLNMPEFGSSAASQSGDSYSGYQHGVQYSLSEMSMGGNSEYGGDNKQEDEDEDAIKSMENGTTLLKYGKYGKPKYKMFHLSSDHKYLVWFSQKKSSEETRIRIKNIKKISIGSDSKVVQKTKKKDLHETSFTIFYGKANEAEKMWKHLTVTAKNEKEAFVWAQGLKILADASKKGQHVRTLSKAQMVNESQSASPNNSKPGHRKQESVIISIDKLKSQSVLNLFSKSSQSSASSLLKQHNKHKAALQKCVDFVMTKTNYRAIANAGQFDKIKTKLEDLDLKLRAVKVKLTESGDIAPSELSAAKADLFSCSADLDALKQKLTAIVRRPQKL